MRRRHVRDVSRALGVCVSIIVFAVARAQDVDPATSCVTSVSAPANFDLGRGRTFDLTARGESVKYYIGFAEYAESTAADSWRTVLLNSTCPTPPPPAPPPPAPPPPAEAAVSCELKITGYTAATFGTEEQNDFKEGIAQYLNEDKEAITITSFTDVAASGVDASSSVAGRRRRRGLLQSSSQLDVRFAVNVRDFSRASVVAEALTPSSGSSNATYDSTALLSSLYVMGLRDATALTVTSAPALAAPPPSPPSPPPSPPPPPPSCGNGAYDALGTNPDGSTGETCDPFGNSASSGALVEGCDPNTCSPLANWRCDDVTLIGTATYNCTCNNEAGTYAVSYVDSCAQTPCVYADRCLANGRGCAPGAGGNACNRCLTAADVTELGPTTSLNKAGYYKVGQICEVCPATSAAQIFAAAALVVVLAFFGFKASQVMGAQATNNMKKIVESLQFFSLSLGMSVSWPGPVLRLGRYLEAFTFSIDFLRPECVATGLNWLNIFLASVFFVPLGIFLIIVFNDARSRRRYDNTVRAIHSETSAETSKTTYWIERPGYLWGTRRTFASEGGDKIVKELQRQYRFRSSLRSFGVLSMTVLYLPIVRMCLQSYDCIRMDGVEGLRLEHDIDIDCESPSHQTIQACASVMLALVGIGMPLYVIRQVRRIRIDGKLDDPRTLDSFGPFYDIYRRDELTHDNKLEIVRVRDAVLDVDAREPEPGSAVAFDAATARVVAEMDDEANESAAEEDGTSDDAMCDADVERAANDETTTKVDESSSPKKKSPRFNRTHLTMRKPSFGRTASTKARERAAKMKWKDRFALYYLAIELAQKSVVIISSSQVVVETALDGWVLVFTHWFIGVFVYVCQPWRVVTLGFGKWKIANCLNKVEAMAGFLQGVAPCLAMSFPVQRDEFGQVKENLTFTAMTVVLTTIITGLLSIRVFVFVGERLAVRRKKMDIEKDPEECMVNVRKQFIKLAKSGAVVSLFAFKADFDVKRRKARARLEDTRHAMMTRIADLKSGDADVEEQITALYKVANAMAHVVNALLPMPIDGARSVATRCDAVEDYLASLLAEEDARFDRAVNASTEASSAKAAHLALKVHAYDRALARLERDHLREYAAAERVADLAVLGQKYRALRARQSALSTGFGDDELNLALTTMRSSDVVDAIRRAAAEDEDARDAVDGLARASAVMASHARWCREQITFFEYLLSRDDDGDSHDSATVVVPREPPLTTSGGLFDGPIAALRAHDAKLLGVAKSACISAWTPWFRSFGRRRYTLAFAEQTREQLALDVGGATSADDAKKVYDDVVELSLAHTAWCDASIAIFVNRERSDAFACAFDAVAVAATRSLESVRADARAQGLRARDAQEAVHHLVAMKNIARDARDERARAFDVAKRAMEDALARRVDAANAARASRERALAEETARTDVARAELERSFEEKSAALERALRAQEANAADLASKVSNAKKRAATAFFATTTKTRDAASTAEREADESALKRAKATIAEMKTSTKNETVTYKKSLDALDAALRAKQRAARRAAERERAEARRDEIDTVKKIQKEELEVTKLTDDDVAARRAEMRAVKAVRQQQVAAARVDAIEARLNVTKTRDGKDSS